jgi:hypothetical protein
LDGFEADGRGVIAEHNLNKEQGFRILGASIPDGRTIKEGEI